MTAEIAPELQVQQSQTPAVTKKALIAADQAKAQAAQQEAMMRQIMTMFSPQMQGMAAGGQPPSIGSLMQPTGASSPSAGPIPTGQAPTNPQQTPVKASAQAQADATQPQQPQVSRQQMPGSMPQSRTR